ncbi:tRNA pseudouridine synthase-like 1 [Lampris incognitus]|uniref:tRNA pseudouridine synthase-like 1 n=1 Tax=Lampris incognitus TaxID=2546036 RepID=UPI0024B5E520|nr:tRNA pseudouridine synthase-like 1 [Lampris incognitus]
MYNCSRYLIFFQYIGTNYSGAVKVPPHHQQGKKGVQNCLDDAIRGLRPLNPVSTFISSRTDSGVHALSNSAHFDLQRKNDKPPFDEETLVKALNFYLKPEEIRITHAYRVPGDFHARFHAQSRTYVYRIALGVSHQSLGPLTESSLCWFLRNTELDVGAMRDAAALLVGTHDFSSFRAMNSETPFKNPVKTLEVASMKPGSSFAQEYFYRKTQFWELTFKSRSFLYKQVRRMTGALVAVGKGQLSVPQLKELLEVQNSLAYPHNLTAPPHGLFLTKVDYRDADLQSSEKLLFSSGNQED